MDSHVLISIFMSIGLQGLLTLLFIRRDRIGKDNPFFLSRPWKPQDALLGINVIGSTYVLFYLLHTYFDAFRRFVDGNTYLLYLTFLSFVYILCRVRCNRGFADLGFRSDRGARLVLLSITIGSLSFLAFWIIMSLPSVGHSGNWGLVRKCFNYAQWIFGTSVVGPVGEEGFARGIIHSLFRKKYSKPWALIFSSIFFAAMHPKAFQESSVFVAIFGLGLLNGFVYEKTKSLTATAAAHSLVNLFLTGLQFLGTLIGSHSVK